MYFQALPVFILLSFSLQAPYDRWWWMSKLSRSPRIWLQWRKWLPSMWKYRCFAVPGRFVSVTIPTCANTLAWMPSQLNALANFPWIGVYCFRFLLHVRESLWSWKHVYSALFSMSKQGAQDHRLCSTNVVTLDSADVTDNHDYQFSHLFLCIQTRLILLDCVPYVLYFSMCPHFN